jgi:hypothetical protein
LSPASRARAPRGRSETEHHVDRDQQRKSREGVEVFPAPLSRDRQAISIGRIATLVLVRPFSTEVTLHLHLLFERRVASFIARVGSVEGGILIHAVVEVLDTERAFNEKSALRFFSISALFNAHRAVDDHHGTEALGSRPDAGSAQTGSCRARSACATVPSGWPSTAECAGCVLRLRDAAHDHQDVPIRIGIGGAPQRVSPQRHGIVIGVVVEERGAPAEWTCRDDLHQFGERQRRSVTSAGAGGASGAGALRAENPLPARVGAATGAGGERAASASAS